MQGEPQRHVQAVVVRADDEAPDLPGLDEGCQATRTQLATRSCQARPAGQVDPSSRSSHTRVSLEACSNRYSDPVLEDRHVWPGLHLKRHAPNLGPKHGRRGSRCGTNCQA